MKSLHRRYLVLVTILFVILCITGLYVARTQQQADHPKTIRELRQKYKNQQTSWTAEDTQNCLDDYYRINPNAKNPKPGVVTLAAPCPGIPQ